METFVPLRAGGCQQEVDCTFRACLLWLPMLFQSLLRASQARRPLQTKMLFLPFFSLLIRHLSTVATGKEKKNKTKIVNLSISVNLGCFQVLLAELLVCVLSAGRYPWSLNFAK